ncbi:PAS domain-containing sensor histidine kinase [Mesorhizobium sp. WSM4312]|uniref:PAS domain-containing sensor histidine kinase n=1 Tax=Mesorhizobium sp. WSM4312 TaxID=2029411 RepID=UPI000BAEAD13|nr:PAS domain-containing protein [Mesorhizobium sp. WSM4312]PBB69339.1 PAS domain-containing sensor histidine kinase [Mesorhizobium sp. WSM4312]
MEIDRHRVLDALPAMIWIALPDGQACFVNQSWSAYTGLDLEQALISGWQAAINSEDLPNLLERWRALLASGQPGEMEARLRSAAGGYQYFAINCSPVFDDNGRIVEWFAISTEIGHRIRAEESIRQREAKLAAAEQDFQQKALEQNERTFQRILGSIPTLAWTAEPTGAVEFLSRNFLDYLGITAEEAQGWGWTASVHPDDIAGLTSTLQAILASGRPGEAEARLRRGDGQYRWFLTQAYPHRGDTDNVVKWYGSIIDIEDRKRASESLRDKGRNLGLIVNTIPVMVWSARPDGSAEFFNQHYLYYVGLSMGTKDWEPTTELSEYWDLTASVHPDDAAGLDSTLQAIFASGQPGEAEARLRRYDGEYRWFLFRANPLRDETGNIIKWYGTNTDIDDRKRAEEALKRSEAFLAEGQYLAGMGNISWHVTTGEILWSEPLYRIFDFKPGTVITLERIASRVHPEDVHLMGDMLEMAHRGESDFEFQHRIVLPDQSVKHLHLIAHLAHSDSGQIEYIGAVLDITQRRRSEEALEKIRSELAHATRIMSLSALTASIAHEVNQPLSGIVTNAGTCLRMLAADPPNVIGARETARRTIRDGNRAADIIARLRSLFGKKSAAIEPVDLNEAAVEVIALFSGELQRNRVLLRTQFASGLPFVGGDRVQLQQVIMNLLRNAADATIMVDDRPRLVVLGTEPGEDGDIRLFVQDAGVGLDPHVSEQFFEAFYTTKADGMGIGLSVSRSIVESHGGRLWAEANDGPGATFSFSIREYVRPDIPSHPSSVTSAPASATINRGLS